MGLVCSISGQFINTDGIREGEVSTIVENPGGTRCYIGHVSVAYDGLNQRYLVVRRYAWVPCWAS